ncbi:hypothetical protein CEN41_01205 [Fischerella thermalis CCMEE 5330]|uniref:Uncharacterized protein n=1 Tax=Fischerella thermalis CCMEE 5330 TaxID=2019670 RepID=A0A2N6MNM5_9CYAN|nr:hypothetical protein CEN41_01205 [Fischerella thermalis CCMEE 5330]
MQPDHVRLAAYGVVSEAQIQREQQRPSEEDHEAQDVGREHQPALPRLALLGCFAEFCPAGEVCIAQKRRDHPADRADEHARVAVSAEQVNNPLWEVRAEQQNAEAHQPHDQPRAAHEGAVGAAADPEDDIRRHEHKRQPSILHEAADEKLKPVKRAGTPDDVNERKRRREEVEEHEAVARIGQRGHEQTALRTPQEQACAEISTRHHGQQRDKGGESLHRVAEAAKIRQS